MIQERVQVVAVEGGHVLVRPASRGGGCGTCGVQGGCGVSALAKLLSCRVPAWKIPNTVGAAVGDEVMVGVPDAALVTAALLAYLVPILALLAGAALAASAASSESQVALGAGLGLVCGIALARWRSKRMAARLTPRITSRTSR